jgi:hypothetical protein
LVNTFPYSPLQSTAFSIVIFPPSSGITRGRTVLAGHVYLAIGSHCGVLVQRSYLFI